MDAIAIIGWVLAGISIWGARRLQSDLRETRDDLRETRDDLRETSARLDTLEKAAKNLEKVYSVLKPLALNAAGPDNAVAQDAIRLGDEASAQVIQAATAKARFMAMPVGTSTSDPATPPER